MKWHRIQTILLHSYYHATHSKETWIDLFWMTAIQFAIFGFITQFLAKTTPHFDMFLLLGFLLWEIVRIGQYCVTVSILWEVWSRSLSNLFISPLTMGEMMTGQAIAGVIKTLIVIGFLSILSTFAFHFSILDLGPILIFYIVLLLFFSYAAGLFITGLILRFGTDLQSLAWGLIYLYEPFSAVFYPIEALPPQIRWLCYLSPITYIIESARTQLSTGHVLVNYLVISALLTSAYFGLSILFLNTMYKWSRKTGAFARLGN